MTVRPQCLLFLILPLLLVSFLLFDGVDAGGRRYALVGGWQPIKDIKDPHVREIGEFAVSEHNKSAKTDLKFESVVRGETQVVAGTNYRLVLAAKDGAVSNNYEALVWEKPWEGFRNLTSFKRVTV